MKFLAWDVGIKNLAYSILDFNEETHQKDIIDWGVINLMTEVDEKPKEVHLCSESNATGKKCTQKVVYLFQKDDTKGVCKKHHTMTKYKFDKFLDLSIQATCCFEIINKNSNKKDSTEQPQLCNKNAFSSRKDDLTKTYCNQHLKTLQKKEQFEVYEIKKDKKEMVKAQSVLTLAKRLYQHLDNLKDVLLNVEEIIIENQPVLKNPTMKTIQILLYGYFVINGILTDKIDNMHFFSASKKLEAYDDKDNKIIDTLSHLSSGYQINKKASILYTIEMVKNDIKWFKFFNSHIKKDDLADAYLTNCYYIDRRFKINKFAVQKKVKAKTKKEKEEEFINDETKKPKNFSNNLINDSDSDSDNELDKDLDNLDNFVGDVDDVEEPERDVDDVEEPEEPEEDNKPKKKFIRFKKYVPKNKQQTQNKSSTSTKSTPPSTIAEMARFIPKKKVVGLDKFF